MMIRIILLLSASTVLLQAGEGAKNMYENYCAVCHGKDGGGGTGPDLHQPLKHGADAKAIENVILYGVPGTQMPGFADLSGPKRLALARYVAQMNRKGPVRNSNLRSSR